MHKNNNAKGETHHVYMAPLFPPHSPVRKRDAEVGDGGGGECQILVFIPEILFHPIMSPKLRPNHTQKLSTGKKCVLNLILKG